MIHAGVGETHMNAIFATIGLPTISGSSLKTRERDVGPVIENSAKNSCRRATAEESLMTCCGDNQSSQSQLPNSYRDHKREEELTFDEALSILEGIEDDDDKQHGGDVAESTSICNNDVECITRDQIIDNTCKVANDEGVIEISNAPALDPRGDSCVSMNARVIPHTPELSTHSSNTIDTLAREDKQKMPIDIAISQDAAWPKRGKGMNSLAGWATIIGTKTKQCLNFGTRNKTCKVCSTNKKLGKSTPLHDCRRNWGKSAKAMEPSIQVELHKQAMDDGVRYAMVIGDEDSSSIKHIRDQVNTNIEKFSDIHHIKRSLSRKLSGLHRLNKQLTEKVQQDFFKNFTYAVYQNHTKTEEEMTTALRSISNHMFGNHELCGPWCRYERDGENYKHANLPYGKDLTDITLKTAFNKLLSPFIRNPKRLMTMGSTQPNECLNSVVWSKAPKIRNYTSSESFDYRCAAAVLQYNEGVAYVNMVVQNMGMSPRKETAEFLVRTDKKRKYQKGYKTEPKQKRRRIELKKERKTNDTISDIKLGLTYEKECLLNEDMDYLDTDAIPDAPIALEQITKESINNGTLVFVDVETDRLGYNAEMVQLSACSECGDFNRFMLPTRGIFKTATEKTGLKVLAINGERQLFRNGLRLDTIRTKSALVDFLEWLKTIQGQKILVAHNGKRFDFPILCRHLEINNMMTTAKEEIHGVIDSLTVARKHLKDAPAYSLTTLHQHLFACPFDAHNATEDARALMHIVKSFPRSHLYTEAEVFASFACRSLKRISVRNKVTQLRVQLSQNGKCFI